MSELFLKIVNMSISASWVVVAVLALRFCLKKAPKWVNVLLWGIVAARMVFPFSIESVLSLIPSAETISPTIMMEQSPSVQTGVPALNHVINPVISGSFTPAPGASANPLQIWIPVLAGIWLFGIVALFLYSAVSYCRLRRKVCEAVILRDNIYQSENVCSPFVLGIIRPKIYLPYHMDSREVGHVIAHEQTHIRRKDHWWKPLGFLLLTIHWFNPLMWLSYVLLCRDIELACDEKVIGKMGNAQRADYTQALVACSVDRRLIAACPLAFGEIGVKERVKSVMNYKKPAFWIVLASVIVCAVIAVCFLTNPIGFQFDVSANTIVSANHFDMRNADDPVSIEMTPAQISELNSRLAGVKNCKRSDKYAGLTPGYQISAQMQDGSYIRISGYSLSDNTMVDIEQNGKRYAVSDREFQEYLSRICAGGDVSAAFDLQPLRAQYPEYFDLDASAGLDVYVWQMAPDSYYFGLLPHAASPRDSTAQELLALRGASSEQMRYILAAYALDPDDIHVIPWQNPISSYIPECWIVTENGESLEEKQAQYIQTVSAMLFGEGNTLLHDDYPIYDSIVFDVDGDGIDEVCVLGFGRTSGLFTFTFRAAEIGADTLKYDTLFCTEWYDLSFIHGDDGVVRVQGIDQKEPPQTHLFDIAVVDGSIQLTEDGQSISRY
ncbi:M56 family metallopeptidase [Dysosmobacter sp.]|jgi:antirepressor regulating drug resistance, predicted signal transduction N-terminal membrane component|uniref:M56 family metallopeptidase n=1 Tax=Dysosmobacter sp. TaxID=2591382 RepID=UPI003AF1DE7E